MGSPDLDFFFFLLKMDWVGDAGLRAMGDGREGMADVLEDRRDDEEERREQVTTRRGPRGRLRTSAGGADIFNTNRERADERSLPAP